MRNTIRAALIAGLASFAGASAYSQQPPPAGATPQGRPLAARPPAGALPRAGAPQGLPPQGGRGAGGPVYRGGAPGPRGGAPGPGGGPGRSDPAAAIAAGALGFLGGAAAAGASRTYDEPYYDGYGRGYYAPPPRYYEPAPDYYGGPYYAPGYRPYP